MHVVSGERLLLLAALWFPFRTYLLLFPKPGQSDFKIIRQGSPLFLRRFYEPLFEFGRDSEVREFPSGGGTCLIWFGTYASMAKPKTLPNMR
jgi:hypothetical protein